MGKKVFVSYKYGDRLVQNDGYSNVTCRNYVDTIMSRISDVHIYKGEEDDNDLSRFKDETIRNTLRAKIYDSSVTIVLISKGMRDPYLAENDQWIPWEVSYSLKEITRLGRTSKINGVLAVVIPDETGSYSYYYTHSGCPYCNVISHNTEPLFEILRNNMFNRKNKSIQQCTSPAHAATYHTGNNHSYIHQVKWSDFISNPHYYIDLVAGFSERPEEFEIQKVPKLINYGAYNGQR